MKTLKMMTDEELVVLYAEGNNAAFDILLNRYKSSIHSYIYFIVRNKELNGGYLSRDLREGYHDYKTRSLYRERQV